MVGKIQQEYKARDERMACYLNGVESHLAKLSDWQVKHIPREENGKKYALARVVIALPITESIMLSIFIQPMPSIASVYVHDVAYAGVGWMHPIANYLCIDEVLEDGKQAYKLRIQATSFALINNQLYKQLFRGPYLECLTNSKAQYF